LKKQSMASFELWVAAWKPKFGPIYISTNSDKLKYKNAIGPKEIQIIHGIAHF